MFFIQSPKSQGCYWDCIKNVFVLQINRLKSADIKSNEVVK